MGREGIGDHNAPQYAFDSAQRLEQAMCRSMWKGTPPSNPAQACHTVKPWRTGLEDAIGCLPSVANMWQQNVIDLAKASENYAKRKAKRAGTASSTRSVRCLSRR